MAQRPPLIIFDLGGVLVRLTPHWRENVTIAGIEAPEVPPEVLRERVVPLLAQFETGRMDEGTFYPELARRVEVDDVDRVRAAFLSQIVEPYAGVDGLLGELAGRGCPTAVLSNTNVSHWRLVTEEDDRYAALLRVDHHFTSYRIGALKPDTAIYEHVERATGIDPQDRAAGGRAPILFFDDNAQNVAAAQARGWDAQQIDPDADPVAQIRARLGDLL